jgi:hypothetical protein
MESLDPCIFSSWTPVGRLSQASAPPPMDLKELNKEGKIPNINTKFRMIKNIFCYAEYSKIIIKNNFKRLKRKFVK